MSPTLSKITTRIRASVPSARVERTRAHILIAIDKESESLAVNAAMASLGLPAPTWSHQDGQHIGRAVRATDGQQ